MDQGKTLCYQGEGPWNELWNILRTSLRKHGCVRARLDIDVPSSHENYLARWNRASSGNCDAVVFLNIRLPLMEDNRKMGALNICFDPMSVSLEAGMDVASRMRKLCMDYHRGIHRFEARKRVQTPWEDRGPDGDAPRPAHNGRRGMSSAGRNYRIARRGGSAAIGNYQYA
jgi:hypothetical protein